MSRGKHAAAAVVRRLHEAEQRVRALESELAHVRADARRTQVDCEERLRTQASDVATRTVDHVRDIFGEHIDRISDGLSSAAWLAQRVAMTEHLTWLFLKGYVTWDRFDGDREVLKFISVHGNLHAWFTLTGKHAYMHNHDQRRRDKRADPVKVLLQVLSQIDRSDRNTALRESREKLDEVVEVARDAFVDVDLRDVLTEKGWVQTEPTEEQLLLHREIVDTVPEFRRLADLLS